LWVGVRSKFLKKLANGWGFLISCGRFILSLKTGCCWASYVDLVNWIGGRNTQQPCVEQVAGGGGVVRYLDVRRQVRGHDPPEVADVQPQPLLRDPEGPRPRPQSPVGTRVLVTTRTSGPPEGRLPAVGLGGRGRNSLEKRSTASASFLRPASLNSVWMASRRRSRSCGRPGHTHTNTHTHTHTHTHTPTRQGTEGTNPGTGWYGTVRVRSRCSP